MTNESGKLKPSQATTHFLRRVFTTHVNYPCQMTTCCTLFASRCLRQRTRKASSTFRTKFLHINSQAAAVSRDCALLNLIPYHGLLSSASRLQILCQVSFPPVKSTTMKTPGKPSDRVEDGSGKSAGLFHAPQV